MDGRKILIQDDFDVGPILGRGGFAVVHSARYRLSGIRIALKVIETGKLQEAELKRIEREVDVHSSLSREKHPNVVQLIDRFSDSERIYLVLEYCPNGDLYKYLRKHGARSETEARDLVRQLLHGLLFLHERNIVHR